VKKKIAFLVTHGTDTMAWGLSYLNYTLKNLAFNICLVGSQIPMEKEPNGSDGYLNLESAVFALSEFPPSKIMVSMNSGKTIFEQDVWKTDKWDTRAFSGKVLQSKHSNQIIIDQSIQMNKKSGIDTLYIIKTGGTIEQSMDDGVLKVDKKKDVVTKFLINRFKQKDDLDKFHIENIKSIPLLAADSSDLRLDKWEKVAEAIIAIAETEGYTPIFENKLSENVSVLFSTPMNLYSEFINASSDKEGIVFVGYGGGNVNIEKNKQNYSQYSPMGFFEKFKEDKNRYIILTSHPNGGILDPVYENGETVFKQGLALPSMDFSIARSQMKLSFILNNMDDIDRYISTHVKDKNEFAFLKDRIVSLLFLSGAVFPKKYTRDYFERKWKIRIPENDLLCGLEFKEVLKKASKFLKTEMKREFTVEEYREKLGIDSEKKKAGVLILKPDDIVGYSRSGEEINAAANISAIIKKGFEWDIITTPVKKGIDYEKDISDLLSGIKLLFSEGGRQSVYDKDSFAEIVDYASREEMLNLYKELILHRGSSVKSPPGLFICLSHQLIADSLYELIKDILKDDKILNRDSDKYPRAVKEWDILLQKIKEKKEKIFKKTNLFDSIIKQNEKPETIIVDLKKYSSSNNIDKELIEAHKNISDNYSGIIEYFIGSEKVDIAMLHGDEIDEEKLLFINWVLNEFFSFRLKYKGDDIFNKSCILEKLPVAMEITSSTCDENGKVLTEVASMVVYFINREGFLYRDFTFQYHPELMLSDSIREFYSDSEMDLSFENDGLKILLTTIIASFERFKVIK